jgi:gamma-glutamyltranspeptidase/glutathione hydrolase
MNGVIAAGHPQTAQAGAEILQQGGNAVDAAVAAAFASFVAESSLVNIGGGGIAQIYNPKTGQAVVYDFFSDMPGLSANGGNRIDRTSLDFRQVLVDFGAAVQPFYIGRGSTAVPGVVAGLCRMASDAGQLPLSRILSPAVRMAREGVVVTTFQGYVVQLLAPILTDTPGIASLYAPGGRLVHEGDLLHFPDLADTLTRLGQEGAALFYTGTVGRKIVQDQQQHQGLITSTDMNRYQVKQGTPIPVKYRGYTVLLPPPSSGGGVLIAFALKLLNTIPLDNIPHNSFEHLRILTEVMRLTNIVRTAWEKEPDRFGVQDEYITAMLADTNIARYSAELQATLNGKPPLPEPEIHKGPSNTTHLSVADANGMLVSITTSAGECSGYVIDDTGIKLNNMLGEIDLHRNGFHQLPPGQRLMTMMSPALVLKENQPILAVGSGGSNRLRSAILQVTSNFIDFNLHLEEAVNAPRLHFEDNEVQLEGGIAAQAADQMESAGYTVNRWPEKNMFFGGAHTVARESGSWIAAGDRRRGGSIFIVD